MKTILVPIDFSPGAANALQYAIQIAKRIKANIHVCHAIMFPELSPMGGLIVWPPVESETILQETEMELGVYVQKVITEEKLNGPNEPSITFSCEAGMVKDVIQNLYQKHKIDLIIMGLSGNNDISRVFIGSTSRDLIEQTKIPILLIPKSTIFKPIKRVAFATDLNETDINAVQHLARIFCQFNPEILLTHVNGNISDFHNPLSESYKFLNRITCKINYSKIYYRHIQQKNINDGLEWLTEKGQIEILAMIHHHHTLFTTLTKGSYTQKMAKNINIPLLVLPQENEPVAW